MFVIVGKGGWNKRVIGDGEGGMMCKKKRSMELNKGLNSTLSLQRVLNLPSKQRG